MKNRPYFLLSIFISCFLLAILKKAFSLLKTSVIIILTQLAGRPRFDAVLLKFFMADTSSGSTSSVDVSSVYCKLEGFTVEVDLPSKLSLTGHFAGRL
jgi:hypothetical protein